MQLFEPHVLSPVLWEMGCKRNREHAVLRTAHSLSCVVGDGMQEEEKMCSSKSHMFSPVLWEMVSGGRENVRLNEPHILSPVLWEMVSEKKKRECVARRATHFLSSFVGVGMWETENMRFEEPHILCAVSYEMVYLCNSPWEI